MVKPVGHIPDPVESWKQLLGGAHSKALNSIHVSAIATVIALNGSRADVKLLAQSEAGSATLFNCYILDTFPATKDIGLGDSVLVVFTDHSLEEYDGTNQEFQVSIGRQHDISDAVIVGRIRG